MRLYPVTIRVLLDLGLRGFVVLGLGSESNPFRIGLGF